MSFPQRYNNAHIEPWQKHCEIRTVVEFVRASVKAGYRRILRRRTTMKSAAWWTTRSTDSHKVKATGSIPAKLVKVTSALLHDTFKKADQSFWFNRIYHQYKTQTKPEADFQRLQKLLPGQSVLDYGCGSGYLARPVWRRAGTKFSPPMSWITAMPKPGIFRLFR